MASPPSPLAQYLARLRYISEAQPARLLSHAYVRYMADMGGGQQVKWHVGKAYGLDVISGGLAFYNFKPLDGSGTTATMGEMQKLRE